jgi:hypothetical protein
MKIAPFSHFGHLPDIAAFTDAIFIFKINSDKENLR